MKIQLLPFQYLPFLLHRSLLALVLFVAAIFSTTVETAHAGSIVASTTTTDSNNLAQPVLELIMVEQQGCEWCQRWNEEIAPIYPKTSEGAFAPLRRVDLRAIPDDLITARRVNFTPTFLIVKDGHEMARLEGYPGEDFFWPLLAQLLSKNLGFVPDTAGS